MHVVIDPRRLPADHDIDRRVEQLDIRRESWGASLARSSAARLLIAARSGRTAGSPVASTADCGV